MNRYFSGFAIAEFNVNAGREILDKIGRAHV